jgi:hypothetical protein
MNRYLPIFALLLVSVGELVAQSTEQEILAAARQSCADLGGGEFAVSEDAVTRIDLDGDGSEDTLIDEGRFACSTSATLFSPTGGAQLHAVVGGRHNVWMAQAWRLVTWGKHQILLLAEHGSQCGGLGYQPCFEAIVWSEDGPRTVRGSVPSSEPCTDAAWGKCEALDMQSFLDLVAY